MWFSFIAGGMGDASASVISHPLDVTKIRLQLQGELSAFKSSQSGIREIIAVTASIYRQEGFATGTYAGFSAALLRQCTFSSMRHGFFAMLTSYYLTTFNHRMSMAEQITSGAIIGATCAAVTNPCDVVLVRMQADGHWTASLKRNYKHVFDGLNRVASEEGVVTLWKGASATMSRGFLVTCSQLPVYHAVKARLLQTHIFHDNIPTHIISSIASAATASLVSCPADVVKTRLMNMRTQGTATYSGALDCVAKILQTEGLGGLYKGLGATFARLGPHTILMWVCQEQYLSLLRSMNGAPANE
ncbi:unnamed protein product [Ectocarpus fasciculatus]